MMVISSISESPPAVSAGQAAEYGWLCSVARLIIIWLTVAAPLRFVLLVVVVAAKQGTAFALFRRSDNTEVVMGDELECDLGAGKLP